MADTGDSKTPQKRVSRACTFCRARKSRCDLEASGGAPPCGRCRKENRECVLGTSNRGGSRIRKKHIISHGSPNNQSLSSIQDGGQRLPPPLRPSQSVHRETASSQDGLQSTTSAPADQLEDDDASTADDSVGPTIPRNPSDAWQLLKDVATREADQLQANEAQQAHRAPGRIMHNVGQEPRDSVNGIHTGIHSYRLVREGYLTPEIIHMLVRRYAECYHPYQPLVPRKYFDPSQLDHFAVSDKHLLTAVLTISSKDLTEQPNIHICCSRYMHDLISGIAAGHDCEVEAVEALLLLAEWEPQGLRNNIEAVGRGEEDRSAWMHVGIALRTGYYLSLDRTAFRQENSEEAKVDSRKRFAWANCYVSDRLISVRIGKAFWSRGPGPMTGLSSHDFPSLQPLSPSDEDYGKIFQAILDLTQLYSNVHDVLYSGMRTSGQMMLMGDYVKYVDDFRTAIARWNTSWGGLVCSPNIKTTLQLSYEYLCLYTNAFVFQAAISQAIANKPKPTAGGTDTQHSLRDHLRSTFTNVGSMPDARFIWASVAAAKAYLTLLSTQIDPVQYLRYMPLRYYLYGIYSAVFLYKARSFGVMDAMEERQVRQLVYGTTEALNRASVSAQDPGSRYARLLELLWLRPEKGQTTHAHGKGVHGVHEVGMQQWTGMPQSAQGVTSPTAGSESQMSGTSGGGGSGGQGSLKMDKHGFMHFSPANDFSWLDLEAVGDYVSGNELQQQQQQQQQMNVMGQGGEGGMMPPMGSGGFAASTGVPQGYVPGQTATGGMGWQPGMVGANGMGWQVDVQGNLLF